MRLLLIAFIAFALSSCWVGTSLYSVSDAKAAISPGVYRFTTADQPPRVARVTVLPNGMTQLDWGDGEKKETYGFAALGANHDTFVAWNEIDADPLVPREPTDPNQMYELMVREPDGDFTIYLPVCAVEAAEIARKVGATITRDTVATCIFTTRAALEAALRLLPRDSKHAMRVTRIP